MTSPIRESELILKPDGSIYHLALTPGELADTVILVGDPGRVPVVSKYFDKIELKKQNREIVSHTGEYNGKRLTVMSTGMGTDSIDIVINELDALVNIDFATRQVKENISKLRIVRFGTSGSLQEEVPLDSYVASTHGVGLDVVLHYYAYQMNANEEALTNAFKQHLGADLENLSPYIVEGASNLIDRFKDSCILGMTATGAGFYAPQGRVLRYKLSKPDLIDKLANFEYQGHKITNFEMETSAIYGLGHGLLGHDCCSLNLVIAHRPSQTFSSNMAESMEKMIQMALDKLTK